MQISSIEMMIVRKARALVGNAPDNFSDAQLAADVAAKLRFNKREVKRILEGI